MRGFIPATSTADELYKVADEIENGFVPDAEFMRCLAELIRIDAASTAAIGWEFGGFSPAPITMKLASHVKKERK